MNRTVILAAAAMLCCGLACAEDRADIDRTQIIGNRELPKVLYIVPWKQPGPGELAGHPLHSVLDEALAPLDRDVFRREVQYHAAIASAAAAVSSAVPSAAPSASPPAGAPGSSSTAPGEGR
jgi:hypothetical protein